MALATSLLREDLFIDGEWVAGGDGGRLPVTDPASGEEIASVANATPEDVRRAIAAATRAFAGWSALLSRERSAILRRWFELIVANADELAEILTAEQGKPLAEARGEVLYGAAFVEWFAEEAKRAYGDVVPSNQAGRRIVVTKQPIGVCAAITPWNFPSAMILRKAGPALAAGCTMVVKPASETPLSTLALAELAARAGLPPGVLNVVHGPAEQVGAELTASPDVRGSDVHRVDRGRQAPDGSVRRHGQAAWLLELGGNAPLIVFDDADLDAAVAGAMASKFRNAGQTCVCANRILVQSGVHDAFLERLTAATAALVVGRGDDPGVEQGPLINERGGREGRASHRGRARTRRAPRAGRLAPRARAAPSSSRRSSRASSRRHAGGSRGDVRAGRGGLAIRDGGGSCRARKRRRRRVSPPTSSRGIPGARGVSARRSSSASSR